MVSLLAAWGLEEELQEPFSRGHLSPLHSQSEKAVALCTLSSSLRSPNTLSAISMPKGKIRGYSPLIAWPWSLSRLKDQGLSVQVTPNHVSKQVACRFAETLQQVCLRRSFFLLTSVVWKGKQSVLESINISQTLHYT